MRAERCARDQEPWWILYRQPRGSELMSFRRLPGTVCLFARRLCRSEPPAPFFPSFFWDFRLPGEAWVARGWAIPDNFFSRNRDRQGPHRQRSASNRAAQGRRWGPAGEGETALRIGGRSLGGEWGEERNPRGQQTNATDLTQRVRMRGLLSPTATRKNPENSSLRRNYRDAGGEKNTQ